MIGRPECKKVLQQGTGSTAAESCSCCLKIDQTARPADFATIPRVRMTSVHFCCNLFKILECLSVRGWWRLDQKLPD